MEEVKKREVQLYQLKKKIMENESKLKQQHTLYEAVCSDRNLCSKNLVEARDEITEIKRKLKIMAHQIDQLKEEIKSKVYNFYHGPFELCVLRTILWTKVELIWSMLRGKRLR